MRLSLLPGARRDVIESIEWFNGRRDGLGDEFADEVFDTLDQIKEAPERFSENCNGYRACRLKRFTAVLYFRIHKNCVVVVRVFVNGRNDSQVNN